MPGVATLVFFHSQDWGGASAIRRAYAEIGGSAQAFVIGPARGKTVRPAAARLRGPARGKTTKPGGANIPD